MKNIALMNTAIFSFNQGDYIIMESAKRELDTLLKDAFVVEIATHSPMFHVREFGIQKDNSFYQKLQMFDYKFVCGTNLLAHNMRYKKTTWNINTHDSKYFGDMILLGVGTDPSNVAINSYTRKLYSQALSKDFIHSTRDQRTCMMLKDMGYKAINTGCATTWGLTPEHCAKIPGQKSSSVVFTLTDYAPDMERDKKMIEIIRGCYEKIYFWIQGFEDLNYLKSLTNLDDIQLISPNLHNYSQFLRTHDCDFVGTRLHAGIKAMQLLHRTIIISVDNRASDMAENYHLPIIGRMEIETTLKDKIESDFTTNIKINEENIKLFMAQFQA